MFHWKSLIEFVPIFNVLFPMWLTTFLTKNKATEVTTAWRRWVPPSAESRLWGFPKNKPFTVWLPNGSRFYDSMPIESLYEISHTLNIKVSPEGEGFYIPDGDNNHVSLYSRRLFSVYAGHGRKQYCRNYYRSTLWCQRIHARRNWEKHNGSGGIWRIPQCFDGHKRQPVPRFSIINDDAKERKNVLDFFAKFAGLAYRILAPGGHLFIASTPLLSDIVILFPYAF